MNRNLTQSSRAALLAAALAVPALALSVPALAQTTTDLTGQDAADGAPAMDDAPGDDALMEGTGAETDMTDPLAAPTGLDDGTDMTAEPGTDLDTDLDTDTGTGEMDQLTYDRVLADLRSGRDFSDQLDGLAETDSVTILGLSELEQMAGDDAAGGAMTTADEPADTTLEMAPETAPETLPGDAAAGEEPPAGMADDTAADAGADVDVDLGADASADPGAETAMDPMGAPEDEIDTALEQAGDSLNAMRESLSDNDAVTQALEDEGYTTDDVIALHRDDTGLTVVVDDRDS